MDEVFDLKSKNLWLRRRIVAVIRQIIQATSGDAINRKIVDYVEDLTSASSAAELVKQLKISLASAPTKQSRSQEKKQRTAVIAKSFLISSLSDDLKHLIGSETTKNGLLKVFDMFQNQTLNRRLILLLFEGLLIELFPDNFFPQIFQRLHSTSLNTSPNHGRQGWPPFLAKFMTVDAFKSPSSFSASSSRSSPVPSAASSTRGSPLHSFRR
jgi:sorting nexin-13